MCASVTRPAAALAALLVASLPLACATGSRSTSPSAKRAAADVALVDGPPFRPSRRIRQVETVDCASTLGEAPEIARAREALKRQAIRYGGNVVGNIMCDVEIGPPHSDCWEIARCTGDVECASTSANPWLRTRCL
ncbi:MAG TPA: hypothetical protein VHL80_00530 [Polyangia bacterium]|nr:hypothetical protein [Polyangia bacterium]